MKSLHTTVKVLTAAAALYAGAGSAFAGYTSVNADRTGALSPPYAFHTSAEGGTPISILNILDNVYGGTFTPTPGFTSDTTEILTNQLLSNGLITATRINDDAGSTNPLNIDGSDNATADDRNWSDGTTNLEVQARFAAAGETFGWRDNNTSIDTTIFSGLNTNGFLAGPSTVLSLSNDFQWKLTAQVTGGPLRTYYSDPGTAGSTRGPAGTPEDHMVTYYITGTGITVPTWMVFWENNAFGQGLDDHDYNDLAVEIRLANIVPIPTSALMGLSALGLLGLAAKVRKSRVA